MSPATDKPRLKTEFHIGSATVSILQGDIMAPGVAVEAVVSPEDNYLTMGAGVARDLRMAAGPEYVREALRKTPIKVGTAAVTGAYDLPAHGLPVRYVFHAATIDYDTDEVPPERAIYQATADCLEKAAQLKLNSLIFPAIGAGSAGVSMETSARQICQAIKVHLANASLPKTIYIILRPRKSGATGQSQAPFIDLDDRCRRFVCEANLTLDVPYSPAEAPHNSLDFYGRIAELQLLKELLEGKCPGKRHGVVLGGPHVGKNALLAEFHRRTISDLPGLQLVKVTFGQLHRNTPSSFIYRKFVMALKENVADSLIQGKLEELFTDPDVDCGHFLTLAEEYPEFFARLVFLIDDLPRLQRMESEEIGKGHPFWEDLDQLDEAGIRFLVTARSDRHWHDLKERLAQHCPRFSTAILPVSIACLTGEERQAWVERLYMNYLERPPTDYETQFIETEAGRHPYLISLVASSLIREIKRDLLSNPAHPKTYHEANLQRFFRAARAAIEVPRRDFFDQLLGALEPHDQRFIRNLARAIDQRTELESLAGRAAQGDQQAAARFAQLQEERLSADDLDPEYTHLRRLQNLGYLVDAQSSDGSFSFDNVDFMSAPFAETMQVLSQTGMQGEETQEPESVRITLLEPQKEQIRTLFSRGGASHAAALKPISSEMRREFMEDFRNTLNQLLSTDTRVDTMTHATLEDLGMHLLTQYMTTEVKRFLQDLPKGTTIQLEVDESLMDIPWELVLETTYSGEVPFRLGRQVITSQPRAAGQAVNQLKALLIADPTDDLPTAREEALELAEMLPAIGFDKPTLLVGAEQCERQAILKCLSSQQYGLVHYSGHSGYDGYHSAWLVGGGKRIDTLALTNALSLAPPALVVSSSCESGVGSTPQPIRFEDQTFNLPMAFLQAGVETYIGSLWKVDAEESHQFVKRFYTEFMKGDCSLGECMQHTRNARQAVDTRHTWQAFILYGDPKILPRDMFPGFTAPNPSEGRTSRT